MTFGKEITVSAFLSAALWLLMFSPAYCQTVPNTEAKPAAKQNNTVPLKNDSLRGYMDDKNKETKTAEETVNKTEDNGKSQNWISGIASTLAEKGAEVMSSDDEETVQPRSNASVFDISGVMLRMNVSQVLGALAKRGYVKTAENYEIPNFIRWRYEEACRLQGVVGYERTEACVVRMAQKNNYQFIEKLMFSSYRTQETMEIHFTSNFTGNKVYSIIYHSAAANVKGSGIKADYLRNLKVFDFWKKINQKYGVPDNKQQVLWGLGENKPYLKAATGYLLLHDPMLLELDYARMSREDQKFMNTAVYTF